MHRLSTWWQSWSRTEDTPFDADARAWTVSFLFHAALLVLVAVLSTYSPNRQVTLTLRVPAEEEERPELSNDFYFSPKPSEWIGANSRSGVELATSDAPVVSDVSLIPTPRLEMSRVGRLEIDESIKIATGLNYNKNFLVRGSAAMGTNGTVGAVDRITREILLSLEERKTLVVWLFDQSGSMAQRRKEIHDRFDRIYEELGFIEHSGHSAFAQYQDSPLLTSVVAFGKNVTLRMERPSDDLEIIKAAVRGIELDDSGIENVFSAIHMAADRFKKLRAVDPETRQPVRNVMFVVVTDEVGDDQQLLDATLNLCRGYAMPVYVIGVPAPFGRQETLVKWVDPDPKFDQTPKWGIVNQGPESLLPERIKLHFSGSREDAAPLDSGFGPFALTRLCYETGGIYFAVHPNRNVGRPVGRRETADYAAHIRYFFDPEVMRRYRPDYVSAKEYMQGLATHRCRGALVKAAQMSWLTPLERPRLRFVKTDEAALASALTEAQKEAAKLDPKIEPLYATLKLGEADRPKETTPRWQAGFDLAMGRVLAVKTRSESYNAMLALAKRGMKFNKETNNTWRLTPDDDISVGSQLEQQADRARQYLNRVVKEHKGTPWALLAKQELKEPMGWKWQESFTDLNPPSRRDAAGQAPPPRDDRRRMLDRPKPKRPLPKL